MKIYTHSKYSFVRVVEIPKEEIKKIDLALCKQPKETLSAFYNRQSEKPDIVCNCGFFGMSDGGTCFNFVDEYQAIHTTAAYQWGMGIIGDTELEYGSLKSKKWRDFVSGYPNLIDNGQKVKIDFATELNYKARRTMLGYNNTTIFLVFVESPGLAFNDMQNLMLDIGCKYAINCDGGGSTKALHNGKAITKDATDRAIDNVIAVYLKPTTTPTPDKETPQRKENEMISCFKGKFKVTSPYGTRILNGKTQNHSGIDLVGVDDWTVYAPCDGTIGASTIITDKSNATWQWGHYVRLDTADKHSIFFCHLASRAVSAGQKVKKGDKLGVMGNTGYSFGAHTHFEVRKYGTKTVVDPAEYTGIPNKTGTYEAGVGSDSVIDVTYQVYSKGKWWGKITNYNDTNSNGYAGIEKSPTQAIKISLSEGSVQYRAHTKDGKWWSWITDSVGTGSSSYSGVIGKDIDAIQIKLVGDIAQTHNIKYRVSTVDGNGYLGWINGVSGTGSTSYAGIMGKSIDKIQMYVEKK